MRSLLTTILACFMGIQVRAQPNILFCIADDWGLHAGSYGTPWAKTPNFDRLANEGLLFANAYTPVAKCGPSRSSVITGRPPWLLEEGANHLARFPAKFRSWPEALMEKGWHVGITGKGWGPGIALDAEGKPRQITGKPYTRRTLNPPARGISKLDYAANFIDFLDDNPDGKPWCFWYGALEPHRDYEAGSGIAKGGAKTAEITRVPGYWPDNETVRSDMLDYAFEVSHMDAHLGRMLDELARRGLLRNTLVIVTSDHGMPFPRVKGQAYHDANHVPFAVHWPDGIKKSGRVITGFVDFTDIAPTVLEVAGVSEEDSGMAPITGKSLLPILRGETGDRVLPERDHVLIGKERTDVGRPHDQGYPIRGLIRAGFLFLRNYEPARWPSGNPETGYLDTDGSPTKTLVLELGRKDRGDPFWKLCFGKRPQTELYDLSKDPDCVTNLAGNPEHAARMVAMERFMRGKLTEQGDPRMSGKGDVFDAYPPTGNSGFYESYMKGERPPVNWVNPGDFERAPLD